MICVKVEEVPGGLLPQEVEVKIVQMIITFLKLMEELRLRLLKGKLVSS